MAIEGELDTLLEILLEAAAGMEKLADCEMYMVNISDSEPNSVFVYVYEVWSNENAHQASLGLEVTQKLIQRAKPFIAAIERIHTLQPIGGKGLTSWSSN